MPQWRQEGKASSEGSLHSSGPTVLGEELQRELGGGGGELALGRSQMRGEGEEEGMANGLGEGGG